MNDRYRISSVRRLLAVTSAAVALVVCAGSAYAGQPNNSVAAVIKDLDNPFFGAMGQGLQAEAKATGTRITVQAVQNISDSVGQENKLQSLAGQSYGCYIVDPISQTNLVQPLVAVSLSHRPIINIDNPISSKAAKAANLNIGTYIGTDNISAGKMAAGAMAKRVPKGAEVAMIGGIPGGVTSQQRLQGFRDGANTAKLKIVQTVSANWQRERALTAATDILHAHPNLKGFFVANDDMALGVVRAVANAGLSGKIAVVSIDGIKAALKSIKQGGLSATVSQYPYSMGAMGVQACLDALAGKSIPHKVKAPVLLVTRRNVSTALAHFPKPFKPYSDPFVGHASN